MKLSRFFLLMPLFLSLAALQGCALFGGGQQQQVEEISQDEDEDQQQEDDEQEGDEDQQENQLNEMNSQIPSLSNSDNAMTNESMMANIANNNAAMLGSDGLGLPEGGGNLANEMALPNEPNVAGMEDLNNMMNESLAGSNLANQAEAAPAATPALAPGSSRVFYVLADGAELKDAPDGNTIQTLEKGDPLLVSFEGDWANAANRGYVQVSQLSESPVGRTQEDFGWQ